MRRRSRGPLHHFLALLAAALLTAPPPVWAGPKGEKTVSGKVKVSRKDNRTKIRASDDSIIQWDSFDIGRDEKVRFVQPDRKSRVLNRIDGANVTRIDGQLKANGQVYIVNPEGVYFGGEAIVDVGRLVAVAGSLTDDDFAAGLDRFRNLQGGVENHGLLRADDVALAGASVANYGRIESPGGGILMLSGDEVWLSEHDSYLLIQLEGGAHVGDEPAVFNAGSIDAGRGQVRLAAGDAMGLAIRSQGDIAARRIALEAGEGRVDVSGSLDARNRGDRDHGGKIDITGDWVLLHDLEIDASGREGGGRVRIGGAGGGDDDQIPRAIGTYVASDVSVHADAIDDGDGGRIIVWGDDVARSFGQLSARGGADGGDGGFVETSGLKALEIGSAPDLTAASGDGGEWLIDPLNITIVPGEGSLDDADSATPSQPGDEALFQSDKGDATVGHEVIIDALSNGTDVRVTTARFLAEGQSQGDITIESGADIVITESNVQDQAVLTLQAANDIVVNGRIASETDSLLLAVALIANNNPLMPFFDPADSNTFQPELGQKDDVDNNAEFERGDVTVNQPIETRGGAVLIQGVNVNVNQPITTDGGSVVIVGTNPRSGSDRVRQDVPGDVTLLASVDTSTTETDVFGGEISVTAGGEALLDAGANLVANNLASITIDGRTTDVQGNIDAGEGGVNVGRSAVLLGPVDLAQTKTLTVAGDISTDAGSVVLIGKDTELDGAIDTTRDFDGEGADISAQTRTVSIASSLDAGEHEIQLKARNDVQIEATGSITGASVDLRSGLNPTSDDKPIDLVFAAGSELRGDDIKLIAGDGATISNDAGGASVDVANASIRGYDDPAEAPLDLRIVQDADLTSGQLPGLTQFADANGDDLRGMTYTLQSVEGQISVAAGDGDKFNQSELTLNALTSIDLQNDAATEPIAPETARLKTDQKIVVSEQDDPTEEDLLRLDRVRPTRELEIAAGADGSGDLSFSGDVDFVVNELTLRAGDGPGGGDTARVLLGDADGVVQFMPDLATSARAFTVRQDGPITDADVPDASAFVVGGVPGQTSGVDYTLRSDEGSITLEDASKVFDTEISLLASDAIEIPTISVRSAEVGGISGFRVAQELIDDIVLSTDAGASGALTLRAAVGGSGDLSFDDAVDVRANEIRLVASSKGEGGSGTIDVRGNDGSAAPLFQNAAGTGPPDAFVVRQAATINDDTLPRSEQFGGGTRPLAYALRSDGGAINLSRLSNVPDGGVLTLDATRVSIQRDNGKAIDFTSTGGEVEVVADEVLFETLRGNDADGIPPEDMFVDASSGVIFGDFDDEVEDFAFAAPVGAPDSFTIHQEATLEAAALPPIAAFGGATSLAGDDDEGAVVYALISRRGSIDLTGLAAGQVDGSNLQLVATPFGSKKKNKDNIQSRTISLGGAQLLLDGLVVDAPGRLNVDDGTSVDATRGVLLRAGAAGVGGNLGFGTGVSLRGESITLDAGDGAFGDDSANPSKIKAQENAPEFIFAADPENLDSTTSFLFLQDATVKPKLLPLPSQYRVVDGIGNVDIGDIRTLDSFVIESREKSVTIDDFEAVNARTVGIFASSSLAKDHTLKIIAVDGDLDFESLIGNGVEDRRITLGAPRVVLRTEDPSGVVLANTPDLSIIGRDNDSAPRIFQIKQETDLRAAGGVSPIPALDQFGAPPVFSKYRLVSTQGDVRVNEAMADDLVFTDLRIRAANRARIAVDRSDVDQEDSNSAPQNLDLASLEVVADEIVLDTPVLDGGFTSIRTFGQQIYSADSIIIAEDTTLLGRSVDFQGPVDAKAEGSQSLRIKSFGPIGIREDVGMNTALHDFEIRYKLNDQFPNTTEFGRRGQDNAIAIRVTHDIDLNDKGRDSVPNHATFFKREGDLSLESMEGGEIVMGEAEKLSVTGNLTLASTEAGGRVAVSDLVAKDRIRVTAPRVEFVLRGRGEVRQSDGTKVHDAGVHIVANEIDFEFDEIGVVGNHGRYPLFGVPDPLVPPDFISDLPARQRYAVAGITRDGSSLQASDFSYRGKALDLHPEGPSSVDLATATPGMTPRPGRPRPVDGRVESPKSLIEVGIDVRNETPAERRQWLDGAAVYDDSGIPRRVARVAEPRIEADSAMRSRELYTGLFGSDRQNAPEIRRVLQEAVDNYLQTTRARLVVGFEFRRFVKNRPSSQFAAYQALEDLDSLFRAHRNSGLSPAEYRIVQFEWLRDVQPDGITLEELSETIHPSRYVRGSDILDIFGQ